MAQEQRKTFDNTSSSYLSLKAELLRKKQDIQRASSSSLSSSAILDDLQSSSSSLKLKKNSELDVEISNPSKKKKKNNEIAPPPLPPPTTTVSREDEIAFAKSRAILEAKSKLYDQIMSNNEMKLLADDDGDDDDEKSFLVDFGKKIYETNQNNNSNTIEYTDSFGRTRLVTPDEYEQRTNSDKPKTSDKNQSENEISRVERLHREQMRSKWEAEMEELRNKTHVHYQDVLFDEKREHGVGYYKFSTDDKQRAEQMTTLNDLRTNTKIEQNKFHHEKEKKQLNTIDRLTKIRLRKAKEMGIDLSSAISTETHLNIQVNLNTNEQPSTEEKKDLPEIVKPSQVSEQVTVQTPRQQPPLQKAQTSSNSSFAYPFPVVRINQASNSS